MALTDNIVAYWKMDEASGNRSDSVASNTLNDNNTVPSGTGIINNGADFERGNSESLSISDASQTGLDMTGGNFTFSCWLKIENDPTSGQEYGIIDKEATSGSGRQYRFSYQNDAGTRRFLTGIGTSGGTNMGFRVFNQTLTAGTWYFVVWTYTKSTNTSQIYVNASSIGSGTLDATGALDNASGAFRIGGKFDTPQDFYSGLIDEVGAWSRVLSGSEITELYNSGAGKSYPFVNVYTIAADLGTYVLTGIAAAVTAAIKILADLGTYTLTGIAAALARGRGIATVVGAFVLTGIDAGLTSTRSMIATLGTYVLTGIDAALKRTFELLAELGTYVLTGFDVIFGAGASILAALGTFTLTGIDAAFVFGKNLIAETGVYTLTGFAVVFPMLWKNPFSKNNSTWIDKVKNIVSITNIGKTNF